MSRHLPVKLVSALDSYLERKHERVRRDSILTGLSGLFLLLSGIWQGTHGGGWPAVFMLVGALLFFVISAWEMLVYKRSQVRSPQESVKLPEVNGADLMTTRQSQIPASVTERTTHLLDQAENHSTHNH
jgi:hypothetical protein